MRNHILWIILILMVAVTPLAAKSASQAGSIPLTPEPVPVETGCNVAAAYMPFWGIRPYQSWGDIDRHASYYPFLGAYTSDDPYIYDWHVYWARSAGIDTFMFDMGWFSPSSSIADAIEDVLNQSMYADDMRFTFNYFTSLAWWAKHDNPSINTTEYVMNDFEILAERFLWRDNLLHINGVPVIYMVSDWDYNDPILANIVEGIREVFRSHLATDVMILIDYVWPGGSTQISDTGVFDGVYKLGELGFVWEHYGWGDMHSNYSEMWHYNNLTCYEYSSADLPGDMVFAPCIMPGFNNTLLYESGQNENLLLVDRDADLYESGISQLVDYVDPSLNMLYLHTWNDLQEGTSIEPAVEYGLDFVEAVYSGLTDSASIPAFYTPESYAEEVIELAETAIDENRTLVNNSVLQLALDAFSQAEANFTAEEYREATALAIEAYELMNEPAKPSGFPMELILVISVIGVACVVIVAIKLRNG